LSYKQSSRKSSKQLVVVASQPLSAEPPSTSPRVPQCDPQFASTISRHRHRVTTMLKSKQPSPRELYNQRKLKEERERAAFLPPGLLNHGNTCFMNSVLQGIIATRLLHDLATFAPISTELKTYPLLDPARSPQLTNGHGVAGPHEQTYIDCMPIGDRLLSVMYRAWDAQLERRRESISPKPLLNALGRKYQQYLDFAQQDAHEFMRILFDAVRMEEIDVRFDALHGPSTNCVSRSSKNDNPN